MYVCTSGYLYTRTHVNLMFVLVDTHAPPVAESLAEENLSIYMALTLPS